VALVLAPAWADDVISPVASDTLPAREVCDLAIVGGGILGLSAALDASRRGLQVRVLDAARVGDRASGVNGGQVIAGLIEREKLAVPFQRSGWIQAAHSEAALRAADARASLWRSRGVAARTLDERQVARMTGARGYLGGWVDPRGGAVQPLAYVRELARVATEAGVKIAQNTRVSKLERRDSSWNLATADGKQVEAKHVIVATNAYADGLIPGLAQTLLPLHSFQIGTAPLPDSLLQSILPGGQVVSDSRRIVVYYRRGPNNRMLLGGRGSMGEPHDARAWAHLEHALRRLYPALQGVAIEKRWYGRVAMTLDHLPHVHEPERGLIIAAGCQGRGVGLMTALGPRLVDYLTTRDTKTVPLPITPIRPIPLHAFRNVGISAAIAWYRFIDMLDR
jgi:glycine/D-amino acid oxidase-like deaminating enzyme